MGRRVRLLQKVRSFQKTFFKSTALFLPFCRQQKPAYGA
ncbi:hypothetical protein CF65_01646 [Aggregatibacter actinomycetemcomitans HK1651]|nr:hypothetical protein CF65_01646 [Aggregatibacter actinomycetemcomitans HK1651]